LRSGVHQSIIHPFLSRLALENTRPWSLNGKYSAVVCVARCVVSAFLIVFVGLAPTSANATCAPGPTSDGGFGVVCAPGVDSTGLYVSDIGISVDVVGPAIIVLPSLSPISAALEVRSLGFFPGRVSIVGPVAIETTGEFQSGVGVRFDDFGNFFAADVDIRILKRRCNNCYI
jgi:hypothetical protein